MTPHEHALELIALAEEDLYMARSLASDADAPDRGPGYFLQQATEKLLKALLAEKTVDYPRTHRVRQIMDLVAKNSYKLPEFVQALGR